MAKETTHTHTLMDRWERLERYARWRRGRFPLHELPHDVLAQVMSHLDGHDVSNLVEVVVGERPRMDVPAHIQRVPVELRPQWLYQQVYARVEAFLASMSDVCFFHAKEHTHVCVFFDWSPFARKKPVPVAQFRWVPWRVPRARMTVNPDALHARIHASVKARRPEAHVAVHTCLMWNRRIILHPRPILQTHCPLVPHFFYA
jgi:hypothetical protein